MRLKMESREVKMGRMVIFSIKANGKPLLGRKGGSFI
jgi:hypothetical protein